ncbi:MAG TPA: MFS transporter [Anaeromyxobacter sp.]|nr:MFS transporter [Anaeromyxobacter sp.]
MHLRRPPSAFLAGVARLAAAPAAGLLSAAPLAGGRSAGPTSRLRRSLRASTAEGLGAELINALAGPTILAGWALHLGASPLLVGALGALPQLAQLAQLPSALVTAALGRRRVAIAAVGLSRLALLPLALSPLLDLSGAGARHLLLSVAAASAVLGVLGNNAWTAWMGELVPEPMRGRYFGRRTALCTLGGTMAGVGVARFLDAAAPRGGAEMALSALAGAACLTGLVTTVLMARQHDPPAGPQSPPTLGAALRPARDPQARGLLAYQVAWNASVGAGGGFFTFWLLHDLRVGFTVAALHAAASAGARTLAAPLWGRAVDRFGARPVLAACSFAAAGLPLVWLATSPGFLWPIAADAVVGGIAWSGHGLASFALPLSIAPRRDRPYYLAAFAAAGGVAYAAATWAGGALTAALPGLWATLGAGAGSDLAPIFALSAAGRLASAFLALRIAERGAGTLAELHAAVRSAALGALAEARVRARAGVGPG